MLIGGEKKESSESVTRARETEEVFILASLGAAYIQWNFQIPQGYGAWDWTEAS